MCSQVQETITSPKHTLVSCFFRLFTRFSAFLVLNTGTLIMGVLMLALATMRISLNLSQNEGTSNYKRYPESLFVRGLSYQEITALRVLRSLGILRGNTLDQKVPALAQ